MTSLPDFAYSTDDDGGEYATILAEDIWDSSTIVCGTILSAALTAAPVEPKELLSTATSVNTGIATEPYTNDAVTRSDANLIVSSRQGKECGGYGSEKP